MSEQTVKEKMDFINQKVDRSLTRAEYVYTLLKELRERKRISA